MASSALKFDFVDNFDSPIALIDVSGVVLKTNDLLKSEKNLSVFTEGKSYIPDSTVAKDWQSQINNCLSKGSAEFELNSVNKKCQMTRLSDGNNKVILVNFSEASVKGGSIHSLKQDSTVIKLPQSNPLQKEFTEIGSCVAHAINNPLTVITTRTQMLQHQYQTKKPVTEEMLIQYLGKVEAQSERIKNIVEILRSLVKYPPPEEYVDQEVNNLVGEAFAVVAQQLEDKKIKYIYKGIDEKWVKTKPAEIIQIFSALFVNSIEAFEIGKTEAPIIEVRFEEDPQNFHFYVTDNGPGIKEENFPKIFKPFFTTKTNNGVTSGVGLSVGRKFARSYGGELTNESSANGNCVFHLTLPKSIVESKSKPQAA